MSDPLSMSVDHEEFLEEQNNNNYENENNNNNNDEFMMNEKSFSGDSFQDEEEKGIIDDDDYNSCEDEEDEDNENSSAFEFGASAKKASASLTNFTEETEPTDDELQKEAQRKQSALSAYRFAHNPRLQQAPELEAFGPIRQVQGLRKSEVLLEFDTVVILYDILDNIVLARYPKGRRFDPKPEKKNSKKSKSRKSNLKTSFQENEEKEKEGEGKETEGKGNERKETEGNENERKEIEGNENERKESEGKENERKEGEEPEKEVKNEKNKETKVEKEEVNDKVDEEGKETEEIEAKKQTPDEEEKKEKKKDKVGKKDEKQKEKERLEQRDQEREKKDPLVYKYHYLQSENKLIVTSDNFIRMISQPEQPSSYLSSAFLDLDLIKKNALFETGRSMIRLSLPAPFAVSFVRCLQDAKDDFDPETQSLANQLKEALSDECKRVWDQCSPSHKQFAFQTIVVSFPYADFITLSTEINENDIFLVKTLTNQLLSELSFRCAKVTNDQQYLSDHSPKRAKETELGRLESFKKWKLSSNPLATPSLLAAAGLFFQPEKNDIESDQYGDDRCICGRCGAGFASWDSPQIHDPWQNHVTRASSCSFIRNETLNVELYVTQITTPYQEMEFDQEALPSELRSFPNSNLVTCFSESCGKILLFNTEARVKPFASFDAFTHVDQKQKWKISNSFSIPATKAEIPQEDSWVDWVFPNIVVKLRLNPQGYFSKAAKAETGVVSAVLHSGLILVTLHEASKRSVVCRACELAPVKPQVHDRVKVIKGNFKSKSGVVLERDSNHPEKVRVNFGDSDVESIPLSDLAVLHPEAHPETLIKGCYSFVHLSSDSKSHLLFTHSTPQGNTSLLQKLDIAPAAKIVYSSSLRSLLVFTETQVAFYKIDKKEKQLVLGQTQELSFGKIKQLQLVPFRQTELLIVSLESQELKVYHIHNLKTAFFVPPKKQYQSFSFFDNSLLVVSENRLEQYQMEPISSAALPEEKAKPDISSKRISFELLTALQLKGLEELDITCFPPLFIERTSAPGWQFGIVSAKKPSWIDEDKNDSLFDKDEDEDESQIDEDDNLDLLNLGMEGKDEALNITQEESEHKTQEASKKTEEKEDKKETDKKETGEKETGEKEDKKETEDKKDKEEKEEKEDKMEIDEDGPEKSSSKKKLKLEEETKEGKQEIEDVEKPKSSEGSQPKNYEYSFFLQSNTQRDINRVAAILVFAGNYVEGQTEKSYSLALSVRNPLTGEWEKAIPKTPLTSFLNRFKRKNNSTIEVHLDTDIPGGQALLELFFQEVVESEEEKKIREQEKKAKEEKKNLLKQAEFFDDVSTSSMETDSLDIDPELGETEVSLSTLQIRAYGLPERAKQSQQVDKSIIKSTDFQLSLFEKSTEVGLSSIEERKLCLKVLSKAGVVISDHHLTPQQLSAFVSNNIILAPSRLAKLGARVIFAGIDCSEPFRKQILDIFLDLLPDAMDQFFCFEGEQQFLKVLNRLWTEDSARVSKALISTLKVLGNKLYDIRSPTYNILRAHYQLADPILEPTVFRPSSKQDSKTTHKLDLTVTDRSPESTVSKNHKTLKVRFNSIQLGNNWIVCDLGNVCCLTGIEIFWTVDYSSTESTIHIETWISNELEPSNLTTSTVNVSYQSEESSNLILTDLSRKCRYVRIIALPEYPGSYEGATLNVQFFGLSDYISLSSSSEVVPIVRKAIQESEEKLRTKTKEFSGKKRNLVSTVEESAMIENFTESKMNVLSLHNECSELQLECYKIENRLERLYSVEAAISKVERSNLFNTSKIDRWLTLTEDLFRILSDKTTKPTISGDELAEFFRSFCVYGTPKIREQLLPWLKLQMTQKEIRFPSLMMKKYLNTESTRVSASDLFSSIELFSVLKELIAESDFHFQFVNEFLSLLNESIQATPSAFQPVEVTVSDHVLVSWVLLMLSFTMETVSNTLATHPGSTCAFCSRSPIQGARYRCVNCLDYDLCEKCEASEKVRHTHDASHLFLKIPKQLPFPPPETPLKKNSQPLLPVLYNTATPPPSADNSKAKVVHTGVACDKCATTPIEGIRYKCVNCDEFNLCSTCESAKATTHIPYHMFLKIINPLPSDSAETAPKALVNEKALLPFVLHHSLYSAPSDPASKASFDSMEPSLTHSQQLTTPKEEKPIPQQDSLKLTSFKNIVRLLLSMKKVPKELIFLCIKLILKMIAQFSVADVNQELFQHPHLVEFVKEIGHSSDGFLQSSVLNLMEAACSEKTFKSKASASLSAIRTHFRSVIGKILTESHSLDNNQFFLELLQIFTLPPKQKEDSRDKKGSGQSPASLVKESSAVGANLKQGSWKTASAPAIVKRDISEHSGKAHMEDLAPVLLKYVGRFSKIDDQSVTPLCIVFKLLQLCDPAELINSQVIFSTIKRCFETKKENQLQLQPSLALFISFLLSTNELDLSPLRKELLSMIIEYEFGDQSEDELALLISVIKTITVGAKQTDKFKPEQITALLKLIARELIYPDANNKERVYKKPYLLPLIRLLNAISSLEAMQELHAEIIQSDPEDQFLLYILRELIVLDKEVSSPESKGSVSQTKKSFHTELKRTADLFSQQAFGAKRFILLALSEIKLQPSLFLTNLLKTLLNSHDQASYFAIDLKGVDFLFDQLSFHCKGQASIEKPSPIVSAIHHYLYIAKKKNQPPPKKEFEDLLPFAEILGEGSVLTSNSGTYFIHKYPKTKDVVDITIQFDTEVMIKQIQLTCIQNYYISSGQSQFPESIGLEVGSSLNRLIPSGSLVLSSGIMQQMGTYKYFGQHVVKYIRLRIRKPPKAEGIAASALVLSGHSIWKGTHEKSDSSKIPEATIFELLAKCFRYNSVQKYAAEKNIPKDTIELLLQHVARDKGSTDVQNVLLSLSEYNQSLSATILENMLVENFHPFHGLFAGRLCTLPLQLSDNLQKLSKFVWKHLSENPEPSRKMLFFIEGYTAALSYQIVSQKKLCFEFDRTHFDICLRLLKQADSDSYSQDLLIHLICVIAQTQPQFLSLYFDSLDCRTLLKGKGEINLIAALATCSVEASSLLIEHELIKQMKKLLQEDLVQIRDNPQHTESDQCASLLAFFGDVGCHQKWKTYIGEHLFPLLLDSKLLNALTPKGNICNKITFVLEKAVAIHDENQNKLVDFFSTQFRQMAPRTLPCELQESASAVDPAGLNGGLLHVGIRLLNGMPSVPIAFYNTQRNETDALLDSALLTPKGLSLKIDTSRSNPQLAIDDDGLYATAGSSGNWQTAFANAAISSGYHYWEVQICKVINIHGACNIMIGIAEYDSSPTAAPGAGDISSNSGFSYYGSSPGCLYHKSGSTTYGQPFGQEDVIGVELDMEKGTLSFSKNGEDLGVAASSGISGKVWYPAICLLNNKDKAGFKTPHLLSKRVSTPTKLSFSQTEVDLPFKYHRNVPLYACPANWTLSDLEDSINSNLTEEEIHFTPFEKSGTTQNQNPCDQKLQDLITQSRQILDLQFSTSYKTPKKEESTSQKQGKEEVKEGKEEIKEGKEEVKEGKEEIKEGKEEVKEEVQPEKSKLPRFFSNFISRGLLDLIACLWLYRSHPQSTEKPRFLRWLLQFYSLCKVDGYISQFFSTNDALQIYYQITDGSASSQDKSQAFRLLRNALFTLFQRTQSEDKLQQAVKSNTFDWIFIDLSRLTKENHRDPSLFEKFLQKSEARNKHKASVKAPTNKLFWARGTGYGTNYDENSDWSHSNYLKSQDQKAEQINEMLEGLNSILTVESIPDDVYKTLEASCLVPVLSSYLQNDSLLEMTRHIFLYRTILAMIRKLVSHASLVPLMDKLEGQSFSMYEMLEKLNSIAEAISKQLSKVQDLAEEKEQEAESPKKAPAEEPESEEEFDDELSYISDFEYAPDNADEPAKDVSIQEQIKLASDITTTFNLTRKQMELYRRMKATSGGSQSMEPSEETEDNPEVAYRKAIKPLQFGEVSMKDKNDQYVHHYKSRINSEKAIFGMTTKVKRLITEISSLGNGLPLFLESSVFFRIDSDRVDVMQAIITGPAGTPYDSGCFLFDIFCPADYPKVPPVVNLQTTGLGSVRFNPNLYNCGKVCLSLLGTWEGGANEKWNASTSTLLQVLVSIQSLILVPNPYFNEPGYENEMGTPLGKQHDIEYNETIRLGTLQWALTDQMKNPSKGFEEPITTHFKLKGEYIYETVKTWVKEASSSKDKSYTNKMQKAFQEFKSELKKLLPDAPFWKESEESKKNKN